ncbi:MAG TPA: bifunctional phosphopantothenoylcysteine decarboxylase/phosphopantothenate--cysteine ligase CoaBC [Nitrospiria bacterium]|jgi:phosphopantothenoylcysteine decarboxylase/phosphopantothenate--cysteine ligase
MNKISPLTPPLDNKKILLGVTGSIAAYKALFLLRRLKELGAIVTVVMTRGAKEFVTPLSFKVLSGKPVFEELFHSREGMVHIQLGEENDLILIAPATAHSLSKIANGLADDLLSSIVLSSDKPILAVPAMEAMMWKNPRTQRNIQILRETGVGFIGPEYGLLASGGVGVGRFSEIETIIDGVMGHFKINTLFKGERILITAGPTQEGIDPVRFFSNRSSGKMGYALAKVAKKLGASVELISGPTAIPQPEGVLFKSVTTAEEMRRTVLERYSQSDYMIMTAAVADFRPRKYVGDKIKKGKGLLKLEFEKTPDILEELGKSKNHCVLIGFAAETHLDLEALRQKMIRKRMDLLVANDVTQKGAGFDQDTNIVTLMDCFGSVEKLPKMSKEQVAEQILKRAVQVKNRKGNN